MHILRIARVNFKILSSCTSMFLNLLLSETRVLFNGMFPLKGAFVLTLRCPYHHLIHH
jgi:hypothetical protein